MPAQGELVRAVELHHYEARGALLGLEDPAFAKGDVQDRVIPDGVAHEGYVHTRWQLLIDFAQFFLKYPQLLIFLDPLHVTETQRHVGEALDELGCGEECLEPYITLVSMSATLTVAAFFIQLLNGSP